MAAAGPTIVKATKVLEGRGTALGELGQKTKEISQAAKKGYLDTLLPHLNTGKPGVLSSIMATQWKDYAIAMKTLMKSDPITGENLLPKIKDAHPEEFKAFLTRVIAHNLTTGKTDTKPGTRAPLIDLFIATSEVDMTIVESIEQYHAYSELKAAVNSRMRLSPDYVRRGSFQRPRPRRDLGEELSSPTEMPRPGGGASVTADAGAAGGGASVTAGATRIRSGLRSHSAEETAADVAARVAQGLARVARRTKAEAEGIRAGATASIFRKAPPNIPAIATSIITEISACKKKSSDLGPGPGLVDYCTALSNGTNDHIKGLTPSDQLKVLNNVCEKLKTDMADPRTDLYKKFGPDLTLAGGFGWGAPKVEGVPTSGTYSTGWDLLVTRIETLGETAHAAPT